MIIIFFLLNCYALFGSNILEQLSVDHWQNIQEQVPYADLINLSYVNKKCNELFQVYLDKRLEKYIPKCFEKSPLLNFLIEGTFVL